MMIKVVGHLLNLIKIDFIYFYSYSFFIKYIDIEYILIRSLFFKTLNQINTLIFITNYILHIHYGE